MELLPAIANAGGWAVAVFTLVFTIRALARGDLVSGAVYRALVESEKFWRDRALVGTALAERATGAAEGTGDVD